MRNRFQHGSMQRRIFAICGLLGMTSSLAGCHKAEKFDTQFNNLAQDIEQRQNAINHDMATSNELAPMPADSR